MILNQIQFIVISAIVDGFSQRLIRCIVDISLSKGERIVAGFTDPQLTKRYCQLIVRGQNRRNLSYTVACVRPNLRAVRADKCSSGNSRLRLTRRIVAAFHHNRVAGRICAISIEDIICLGASRFDDRIAADLQSTGLLINCGRTLDRTATDAQRSAVRMINRYIIIRYDLAACDIDRISAVFRIAVCVTCHDIINCTAADFLRLTGTKGKN